jgi:ubiquinone/menaquinone biosynthesis C-methylase UbiE
MDASVHQNLPNSRYIAMNDTQPLGRVPKYQRDMHLFDQLPWFDPWIQGKLIPIIAARDFTGRPLLGALVVEGTNFGYPIVHGIARMTPEIAQRYANWLEMFGLSPPVLTEQYDGNFQDHRTVASFGFQWNWDAEPRTEADLCWRIVERHGLTEREFRGVDILDAGAGAGDQSRWLLQHGAKSVVSIELSDAIEVAHKKLERNANWLGIQGDITALPFSEPCFNYIYCEGVIQHTRDSRLSVTELLRVLTPGGKGVATHYTLPRSLKSKMQLKIRNILRKRLSCLAPEKLLLLSGIFAAATHIPVLGSILNKTISVTNPRMPFLKATWSCTYDTYGSHAFQRHIQLDEFISYFLDGNVEADLSPDGGILFRKRMTNYQD